MKILNEGSDAVFGKDDEHLSAAEVASMNSSVKGTLKVRKATDEEEARGLKLVFYEEPESG